MAKITFTMTVDTEDPQLTRGNLQRTLQLIKDPSRGDVIPPIGKSNLDETLLRQAMQILSYECEIVVTRDDGTNPNSIGEAMAHPRWHDWRYAVDNEDTTRGFVDWLREEAN